MTQDSYTCFMDKVLTPGVLRPGRAKHIDVRRLDGVHHILLRAMDNYENDFLSWLEQRPRAADDPAQAAREWFASR
jgi:hypothetical protein